MKETGMLVISVRVLNCRFSRKHHPPIHMGVLQGCLSGYGSVDSVCIHIEPEALSHCPLFPSFQGIIRYNLDKTLPPFAE